MSEPYRVIAQDKTELWHSARMLGVGASEVAAVLGEHPYMTRGELAEIKRGERTVDENRAMRMGHYLEPFVVEEYACEVYGPDGYVCGWGELCQSTEEPLVLATPDAIDHNTDGGPTIIEIKSTSQRWNAPKYGHMPPLHIQLQCVAQMGVTGIHQCRVVSLHLMSRELDVFDVEWHPGVWERIKTEVHRFWAEEVACDSTASEQRTTREAV